MYTFKEFLLIEKNLHQLHLEQYALRGIYATRKAIEILQDLKDQFYRGTDGDISVKIKYDGSPAVVFGIDPHDGRFFVGTKGVFNKTPKLAKNLRQVEELYGEGPVDELKYCFQYLRPAIREGIYQGDLLWTADDLAKNVIDNQDFFTFRPNTITYAVLASSGFGHKIARSKLGIVVHTKYSDLSGSAKEFDVDISDKSTGKALILSPEPIEKVDGISIDQQEDQFLTQKLNEIGRNFRELTHEFYDEFNKLYLKDFEIYINDKVRSGNFEQISVENFVNWLTANRDVMIDSEWINNNRSNLDNLIKIYFDIMRMKDFFVDKFDKIDTDLKSFIKTDKGYQLSNNEGYVAVDGDNEIVKFVDRLEFSKNNFNLTKNWTPKNEVV